MAGGDFNVTTDAGDTVNIAKGAAPTADVVLIAGGSPTTTGVDALAITLTTTDQTDITNSMINAVLTSGGTAATDIARGLFLDLASTAGGNDTAIEIENTAAWDVDIALQNDETVSNVTDDNLVLTGVGGTNNTSVTFDLDGASGTNVPAIVSGGSDLLTVFDGLSIGINGETTENMSNVGFAFAAGNDLYVDDILGVNGAVYIDGVTTLAGTGDGTDALVLTLGDILVTDGDLDVSAGDFNVTLDAADEVDLTKTAGAAATEEGLDLTFTAGAGDGADVYSVIRVAATSANHAASSDKVYGLNIANLTSADAEGDEAAIFVGTGWDNIIDSSGFDVVNTTGATTITGSAIGTDALTLTAGDILLTSGNFDMTSGDFNINEVDGQSAHIDGDTSPTADLLILGNGDTTATTNTDALVISLAVNDSSSNPSSNLVNISPAFTDDGADGTAGETWNVFNVNAYTATLSADAGGTLNAVTNAINVGALTETVGGDETITSTAFNLGTGWDTIFNTAGFDVTGATGATTITGSALGTDALTLTAGDILLTSGNFDMTSGDFNVNIVDGQSANIDGDTTPTTDLLILGNGDTTSVTGTDALVISLAVNDSSSNPSSSLINISPAFTDDGADGTAGETWNVLNINAYTATLSADAGG
ncbi:MAG: hypothetical protein AAB037_03950, partial [Chloroflexota bacterium]